MRENLQGGLAVPVHKFSDYLQPFHRSSFLECALQLKIAKINKTLYFGSSGSFKVIDLDTTKKLVTSACYDRQHAYLSATVFMKNCTTTVKEQLLREYHSLILSCAGVLEPTKSRLEPLKSMFNAENFLCSLSMYISINFGAFALEMCLTARNR